MKNRTEDSGWDKMTPLERADYCEKIAESYGEGFCKDQVLRQAAMLREKAGREEETKKAEGK